MSDREERLGKFLREVSNWTWEDFVRAEKDPKFSTNESIIFTLMRACFMQKMDAIRLSLNRLDGKLKTPVQLEMPKVYYLFPNATLDEGVVLEQKIPEIPWPPPSLNGDEIIRPDLPPDPIEERDLPSMSLRETLREMADYPRTLPQAIIDLSMETEAWVRGKGPRPAEIPKVKSVVAANLLAMAQSRNMDAMTEVFDQIDGKLVETIQMLGDDLYITSYATTAPPGAYINEKGVIQSDATVSQEIWANKLQEGKR